MASHLDLEEQEQLANFKHFWSKYGNLISWLLIVVLGAYAAWNGWQYWQRKSATEAAVLYDELERAAQAKDLDKVQRVWGDVQSRSSGALQGHQAGLLAAKVLYDNDKAEAAKAALGWVIDKAGDEGLVAVARLRLAGLELDAKAYDAALKALDAKVPEEFSGLFADRRGDILLSQGQRDQAAEQFQRAYAALGDSPEYRGIVQAKLNALGQEPQQTASKESSK